MGLYGDSLGGGDTPWVALYNVKTNTQLASITNYSPVNGWQYIALGSAVTLNTTDIYQVSATGWWSPKYASISGFTFGSDVNALGFTTPAGFGGWGTPVQATSGLTSTPNIFGNFRYEVVPEPSTTAFLLFAGVGVVLFIRRSRRVQN